MALQKLKTTAKSMRCSRLFAITGAWSLQLPLYQGMPGIPCQRYRESTTAVQVLGPPRYACCLGFKTSVSASSGTAHNWCLVSPGQAISNRNTEKIFRYFCFLSIDKIRSNGSGTKFFLDPSTNPVLFSGFGSHKSQPHYNSYRF